MDEATTGTNQASFERVGAERPRSPLAGDSASLRTRLWKTLLAHTPCVPGLCDLVESFAGDPALNAFIGVLRVAPCASARDMLAEELGRRETGLMLADLALSDLASHESGAPEQAMKISLDDDERSSAAFLRYVHSARLHYHAAWLADSVAPFDVFAYSL